MATLVLQVAGTALGSVIGGPIGAVIGRAAGALAGAAIDGALLGSASGGGTRYVEGPRLSEMEGLSSTEGAPVPRVYGRARLGGQLIWSTRFIEEVSSTPSRGKGGGKGGMGRSQTTVTTTYSYYGNFAIGVCEGPVAFIRRIWADGREIDQFPHVIRVHKGTTDQAPDPLIVAKEGAAQAPAYRDLCYVVFEHFPLGDFGNRIPQFTFEVVRAVAGGLGEKIKGVCLIPGANEFAYDPIPIMQVVEPGVTRFENRHQLWRGSDMVASLDALEALAPNLKRVSIVASWFGTDLRAGECRVEPRVEGRFKVTEGAEPWSVGGLQRIDAHEVSRIDGRAAYGGTPADAGLIRLIGLVKARGWEVVLYPFVMMDIEADNTLPDPRSGMPGQPPYPWRGRITCDPAPEQPGSPDGAPAATAQVAAFFGTAAPADFTLTDDGVVYAGPDEWSFRRLVLHYAHLAKAAGGVKGFIIGSELVGLTRIRSASGVYPATAQLCGLAADVRAVLGTESLLTYAADWTEYGSHVLGAEVRFPLDPLWAHPAIDVVGIDYYPPFADWRDGLHHADADIARSGYDPAYLLSRVEAGEAYDWYYASEADRFAQRRTPITDGAHGKPWIYRAKDIRSWWANPHVERVGGVELASASPWLPQSKPIWLTEIGIPAVDKGANGPNVFPDPKSSEDNVPPISAGTRDDLIQIRALEAVIARFDPSMPGHPAGANPVSPVYGGRMVDPDGIFVWSWDARPFPAFPNHGEVWADGANFDRGHWITGRIEGIVLDDLLRAVLADLGAPPAVVYAVDGFCDGYVVERPMSARAALEPLSRLFGFDAVVGAGQLSFIGRNARPAVALAQADFVPDRRGETLRLSRAQDTDLPREIRVGFIDSESEYRRASALSRRLEGASLREAGAELAMVSRRAELQKLADIWLQDTWIARETAEFDLSPRRIGLHVGDLVTLPAGSAPRTYRILRIADGPVRRVTVRAVEASLYELAVPGVPRPPVPPPRLPGRPLVAVLDLPMALAEPPALQWLAVFADPWPGATTVWRSPDGASFQPVASVGAPAVMGRTLGPLAPGPLWRIDRVASVEVKLSDDIASITEAQMLGGDNSFALEHAGMGWEVIGAAKAELVAERSYRLSHLLRGLSGSEDLAALPLPADARIVLLDGTLVPLATGAGELGRAYRYRIGPAGRDHSDQSMVEITTSAGKEALLPLSPVRPQARRVAGGIEITWLRRGRVDADAWEPADIPLGEAIEAYEIDILAGGSVVRTLSAARCAVTYAAADELADFGTAQATLALSIVQLSAAAGRGRPRHAVLPIL